MTEKGASQTNFNRQFGSSNRFDRECYSSRFENDPIVNRISMSRSKDRTKKVMDKKINPALLLMEGEERIKEMIHQVHDMHDIDAKYFKNKKFRFTERGDRVNDGVDSVYIHGRELFKN